MTPRLFFLLSTAHRAVQRRAGAASTGLSGAQAGVLFLLDSPEGASIGEVARGLEANPSSMTELVDRMVAAALVERSADPADGRAQRLSLTTAGLEARRRAVASLSELNILMTDGFSQNDIAVVARWLETVRVRFSTPVETSR